MKIILVGGGRMGQEIARRLADEGHDITVVDNNAECLEEISTGVDAMVLYGNGADYNVLTEAGVADADLLILNAEHEITDVFMGGVQCMRAGEVIVKGAFEE